ncbi:hypothetical protein [Dictyobacter vulcani]|nr:hypothetical protein [Dictyobacter vulcani]
MLNKKPTFASVCLPEASEFIVELTDTDLDAVIGGAGYAALDGPDGMTMEKYYRLRKFIKAVCKCITKELKEMDGMDGMNQ